MSEGKQNLAWLCSNENCPDKAKRQRGSSCPTCGSEIREYRYAKLFSHLSTKSRQYDKPENQRKIHEMSESGHDREIIISDDLSDQEIEEAIRNDLRMTLPHHRLSELMDLIESGGEDSGDSLVLAALLNQSKILIRQNELILRHLKRTYHSRNDSPSQAISTAG